MRAPSSVAIAVLMLGTPVAAQNRPSPPQQTLLCGMTIVPTDPKIDSKAVKPTPAGQFTLRVMQPSACAPRSFAQREGLANRLPVIFGPRR